MRLNKIFGGIEYFGDSHGYNFINIAIANEPDLIGTSFPNIKAKSIDHIESLINNDPLIILINKCSNILSLSIFRSNKNISLFPIDIELTFYLLIYLWI